MLRRAWILLLLFPTAVLAAPDAKPEVRAYVNQTCIVADEPFYSPTGEGIRQDRSLALLGLVIGKLTQVLVQHYVSASAQRLSAEAERQDTVYAMTRSTNLYVARFDPEPTVDLNGDIGCMTIVAGAFKPEPAQCAADYIPRTLAPESAAKPEAEWTSSRADDSLQNKLRRANICTEGEPREVFEARFEFSEDGTAYRLVDAGYHVQSLLSTTDPLAERHVFYTLEITQPGASDTQEHLSTAWVDIGRVVAGVGAAKPTTEPTPWLKVPPLSVEARRTYEDRTHVHRESWNQIDAMQRNLARQQKVAANLQERMADASPEVAAGIKEELVRHEVQQQTLEAELEVRRAEYAELPHEPLQLMPVSIQVGITESRSEKKALLALAKIIDSGSGSIASAASGVISKEVITRALEEKPKTRGIVLRQKTEARAMIDLNIPFELNSSELRPDALAQLRQLEAALNTQALADFRFRITGHTDASGAAAYNRTLSVKRAEAVQKFLVAHGIEASRLETAGLGAAQLLLPEKPEDAANRRVEIRNVGKVAR